ncbi:Uncharacterised protein [uncultured Blautia sp.]|nr:Uncharacterised protein [uncultured Blautia sp.]
MGAVLLIIVHIEGEAPSVFIDGVEAGAAIGVEPDAGIILPSPISGGIGGSHPGSVCPVRGKRDITGDRFGKIIQAPFQIPSVKVVAAPSRIRRTYSSLARDNVLRFHSGSPLAVEYNSIDLNQRPVGPTCRRLFLQGGLNLVFQYETARAIGCSGYISS